MIIVLYRFGKSFHVEYFVVDGAWDRKNQLTQDGGIPLLRIKVRFFDFFRFLYNKSNPMQPYTLTPESQNYFFTKIRGGNENNVLGFESRRVTN